MLVLAQFDARAGNKVVWHSSDLNQSEINHIEFQMIPNGLHESTSDTIYFKCGELYGCAVFALRSTPRQERQTTRIFSLAALDRKKIPFKLETSLRSFLEKYMTVEDTSVFEDATQCIKDPNCHPILAAPAMVQWYGPMLFELWKIGLMRARLLLHSPSRSVKRMSQFCYITSLLGSIPSDIAYLLPSGQDKLEYTCLYNVTLLDMAKLRNSQGFCATTTDSLLTLADRDAYDFWIDRVSMHKQDGETLFPTWRDRHRFYQRVHEVCPEYHGDRGGFGAFVDKVVDNTARGLLWWASAGDTSLIEDEEMQTGLSVEGVELVGLFQNFTRQVVKVFASVAQDCDSVILIGIEDIAAMGLDPFASQDRKFLERFSLVWWERPVKFKGCCC